jgi:hypothetical protein
MDFSSNGGPAFPRPYSEYRDGDVREASPSHEGMTLRDYFAAAAMQGLLSKLPLVDQ